MEALAIASEDPHRVRASSKVGVDTCLRPLMRLLHVADLHLNQRWFDWVTQQSSKYDAVIVAGDLQNAWVKEGMHAQAKTIAKFLTSLSAPCLAVTGNHDYWTARGSTDVYAEGGWLRILRGKGSVRAADGDVSDIAGLRVCCNGWLQVPDLFAQADIIVTHAPPTGSPCATGAEGMDAGDPEIWSAVSDCPPTLMLCGHVHQPRSFACHWPPVDPTTWILVSGYAEASPVPQHWVIDTDSKHAVHSSGIGIAWS